MRRRSMVIDYIFVVIIDSNLLTGVFGYVTQTVDFQIRNWVAAMAFMSAGTYLSHSAYFHLANFYLLPSIILGFPPIEATGMEGIVVVGYLIKPSREEDFAKRGALPHSPTRNGLIFLPLNCDLPIPSQLKQVDVVLHEATDEIVTFRTSSSSEINNEVVFTEGMQKLQSYQTPKFPTLMLFLEEHLQQGSKRKANKQTHDSLMSLDTNQDSQSTV